MKPYTIPVSLLGCESALCLGDPGTTGSLPSSHSVANMRLSNWLLCYHSGRIQVNFI